jgi:ParB-like chromosome segregation protein Spo0J
MRKERKEINIDLLKIPERNTRIHPEKQINEIRRSLRKWGQYKNVVTDENYLVLAGNGLVEAMRAEGMKKITAIIMYELSENDKKKLMMADNKTAGLGIDNVNNIEKFISELEGDFDIPGFDDEILKSINATSDEISAALDEYGKATPANLDDIESHSDVNSEDSNESGGNPNGNGENPNSDEKKSVVCPQCGALVWL